MDEAPGLTYSLTLETIPSEVLEHIAFFVATAELLGPPSDLVSLCSTSKPVHAALNLSHNPSLYGAIFRFKFDIAAPTRRLGHEQTSAPFLAEELRRRFVALKRFRAGVGALADETLNCEEDLWMAVFMMLENDGKNAAQLKHFALVDEWLRKHVLDNAGGSSIVRDLEVNQWPQDSLGNRLALWLLWLCDAVGDGPAVEPAALRTRYCKVLRAYAFGAPKYPLTQHLWNDFLSPFSVGYQNTSREVFSHFSRPITPIALPISISAILGFVSRIKGPSSINYQGLVNNMSSGYTYPYTTTKDELTLTTASEHWDCDWARCIGHNLARTDFECFHRPGTLEGAWEGHFAYTEFTSYAGILSGGPPQILSVASLGQNVQVWKLREYHLHSSLPSNSQPEFLQSSQGFEDILDPNMLPSGDALNAFFPPNVIVKEEGNRVIFTHDSNEIIYTRALNMLAGAETSHAKLRDVIIFGDGHSSWGRFKLRGRLRVSDALITILKEYNESDERGRWLYRGYLVGGRLGGRWRDAFSPLTMPGYEGSFELGRRF